MVRVALSVTLVFLAAARGTAQPAGSFEELGRRVKIADRVLVEDASGERFVGRVAHLTRQELTIDSGTGERTFTEATVREVALRHRSARLGAIVGAVGSAAALGLPECNGDPHDQCGEGIIMGAILGAGFGAIAGAFISRTTTVYRAAERQAPHVDLTGEWSLDKAATRLQLADVANLERGTLTIVQSRSTLRFRRVFAMGGAENTFSFELPLDGTETVTQADGETRYSRLYWEGGDLVYATRIVAAAGESTNVVHYRLSADRNTLEARERRRGVDNYDNLWVFRRQPR